MFSHADPTASRALGNIAREWDQMVKLAEAIRRNPHTAWAEHKRKLFTGIYRQLLEEEPSDQPRAR